MHIWLFFSVATSRQHNASLHDEGGCVCVDKLRGKEAPRALCLQICRGHSQVLHGSVHLAINGDNSLRLLHNLNILKERSLFIMQLVQPAKLWYVFHIPHIVIISDTGQGRDSE